jgi:hypothetical protein
MLTMEAACNRMHTPSLRQSTSRLIQEILYLLLSHTLLTFDIRWPFSWYVQLPCPVYQPTARNHVSKAKGLASSVQRIRAYKFSDEAFNVRRVHTPGLEISSLQPRM